MPISVRHLRNAHGHWILGPISINGALFNSRTIYVTLMTVYDPASLKTVQDFDESSFSLIGLSEGGKIFLPFLFLV